MNRWFDTMSQQCRRMLALTTVCSLSLGVLSLTQAFDVGGDRNVGVAVAPGGPAVLESETLLNLTPNIQSGSTGDYSLTMPVGSGEYKVRFYLGFVKNGQLVGTSQAAYSYAIDGVVQSQQYGVYQGGTDSKLPTLGGRNAWYCLDPSGAITVSGGQTVTLKDVPLMQPLGDNWGDYQYALVGAIVEPVSLMEELTSLEYEPVLFDGNISKIVESKEMDLSGKPSTSDTLAGQSDEDEYTLRYMLGNYNVVSFSDIEAIHIYGPVIVRDEALYTGVLSGVGSSTPSTTGVLFVSEYSAGTSSYIGTLNPLVSGTIEPSVQLNYDADLVHNRSTFQIPELYTRTYRLDDGSKVAIVKDSAGIEYVATASGELFRSPNAAWSNTEILQNDVFVDFGTLQGEMVAQSKELMNTGHLGYTPGIVVPERIDLSTGNSYLESAVYVHQEPVPRLDANGAPMLDANHRPVVDYVERSYHTDGILNLEAGGSYIISGTSGRNEAGELLFDVVNLVLPEGYDFFNNPYLYPTTITFEDEFVRETMIQGTPHSVLPLFTINGKSLTTEYGQHGEYGESGNKIIWNFPNMTGNMTLGNYGQNIPGHIVAPRADLWNYEPLTDGGVSWLGGNLNGGIIVNDFHAGNVEMHMWPYDGAEEKGVTVELGAHKDLKDGEGADIPFSGGSGSDAYNYSFDFIFDYLSGDATGFIGTVPQEVTAASNGTIDFGDLVFVKEGEYKFTMKEVVDETANGVIYDKDYYEITFQITQGGNHTLQAAKSVVKYVYDPETGLYAPNSYTDNEPLFVNRIEDTPLTAATLEIEGTKVFEYGDLQDGMFHFVLSYIEGNQDGFDSTGFPITTSNTAGTFTFPELIFSAEGTYKFELSEKIPAEGDRGNITYDETVYAITVEVTENAEGTALVATPTMAKKTILAETAKVEKLEFVNGVYVVDATLTKIDGRYDNVLPGAEFDVYHLDIVDGEPDYNTEGKTPFAKVKSDNSGKILISGLPFKSTFKIVETKAPEDYVKASGYWILVVDDKGECSISYRNFKGNVDDTYFTDDEEDGMLLRNYEVYTLPETGGIGFFTTCLFGTSFASGTAWVGLTMRDRKNKCKK